MTLPCTPEQRSEIWSALRAVATAAGEAMACLNQDTAIDLNTLSPTLVQASVALDKARNTIKEIQADVTDSVPGLNQKTRDQLRSLAERLANRYRNELRFHPTSEAFRITQSTFVSIKRPLGIKSLSPERKRQLNLYLRLVNGLHLYWCTELTTPFYFLAPLDTNGRPKIYPRSTLDFMPRF